MEVAAVATSPVGSDTAMMASEGAAQSTPPVVQAAVPGAGRMDEDTTEGSPGVLAVMERTRRRSPPALLSGGQPFPHAERANAPLDGCSGSVVSSVLA